MFFFVVYSVSSVTQSNIILVFFLMLTFRLSIFVVGIITVVVVNEYVVV